MRLYIIKLAYRLRRLPDQRRGREYPPLAFLYPKVKELLQTATLPLGYPAMRPARDYRVQPGAVNAQRFNGSTI